DLTTTPHPAVTDPDAAHTAQYFINTLTAALRDPRISTRRRRQARDTLTDLSIITFHLALAPRFPLQRRLRPWMLRADTLTPAHRRARHIPDQLWPDWAIRLTDQDQFNNPHLRSSAAIALLLPGSTLKQRQAAALIHPHIPPAALPHHLTRLARTPDGTRTLR